MTNDQKRDLKEDDALWEALINSSKKIAKGRFIGKIVSIKKMKFHKELL